MASRSKRSRHQNQTQQQNYSEFPSQWADWVWNPELRCSQRYRLRAPGQYEYQYGPVQEPEAPRTQPTLNTEFGSPNQYSTSLNYSHQFPGRAAPDSVASLTHSFGRASLNTTHITTSDTATFREASDHNYKVHSPFEFKFGKVFKVLWSEPRGDGKDPGNSSKGTMTTVENDDGKKIHTKVRRFVVISPKNGHCICLAINTYSRQGVTKPGVHASDHTIAYSGSKPKYFPGESAKGMTKVPIKISCSARHKLDDLSRLNYAKPYTVEYNVKVWFIGKVATECLDILAADYNKTHPPVGSIDASFTEEQETSVGSSSSPTFPPPRFSVPDEGDARWGVLGASSVGASSTKFSQAQHPLYRRSYAQDSSEASNVNFGRGAYDTTDIKPYPTDPQPSSDQGSRYSKRGLVDDFALRDTRLEDENNPVGHGEYEQYIHRGTQSQKGKQAEYTAQSYYGHQYEHARTDEEDYYTEQRDLHHQPHQGEEYDDDYYTGQSELHHQPDQREVYDDAGYDDGGHGGPAPPDIGEQDLYSAN